MIYVIDEAACSHCGLCADICPEEAISPVGVYRIDPQRCTGCGECAEDCPTQAIQPKEDD